MDEMVRVECLEKKLSDTDTVTGRHHLLYLGDVSTVPKALAERWAAAGWVKDLAGNIPTGERVVTHSKSLNVQNMKVSNG